MHLAYFTHSFNKHYNYFDVRIYYDSIYVDVSERKMRSSDFIERCYPLTLLPANAVRDLSLKTPRKTLSLIKRAVRSF